LTAALRLASAGDHVTVIERETLPGGLAAGFRPFAATWVEKFYHHIFRSDSHAIALVEALGLSDRLEWRQPVTATLLDGRTHQLDSPVSLMRFSPLPLVDRFRMGATLAALRILPSGAMLEGQAALPWMRRWMGQRATARIWEPLLRGKFGDAASETSMPWMWARIHDRSRELGYVRGGFQQVYDRLCDEIVRVGGEIRLGSAVRSIRSRERALVVETDTDSGTLRSRGEHLCPTVARTSGP
jgi:protoporphyrinogen oxidase